MPCASFWHILVDAISKNTGAFSVDLIKWNVTSDYEFISARKFHRYLIYWFSSMQKKATFFLYPGEHLTPRQCSINLCWIHKCTDDFIDPFPYFKHSARLWLCKYFKNQHHQWKTPLSQAFLLYWGCQTHKHIIKCKTPNITRAVGTKVLWLVCNIKIQLGNIYTWKMLDISVHRTGSIWLLGNIQSFF